MAPVERKLDGASAKLMKLKLSKAMTRGMNLSVATEMNKALVEPKWTYG